MRRLSPALIRHSHNCDLLNGWMSQQYALDFHRGNIFAAADNDIFQTIPNLDEAVEWAERIPTSCKGGSGCIEIRPVADLPQPPNLP